MWRHTLWAQHVHYLFNTIPSIITAKKGTQRLGSLKKKTKIGFMVIQGDYFNRSHGPMTHQLHQGTESSNRARVVRSNHTSLPHCAEETGPGFHCPFRRNWYVLTLFFVGKIEWSNRPTYVTIPIPVSFFLMQFKNCLKDEDWQWCRNSCAGDERTQVSAYRLHCTSQVTHCCIVRLLCNISFDWNI